MSPTIYADLRCLQDKDYQRRGIGYHTAALLRSRRHSALHDWKAVGLLDPSMPDIPHDLADVVDETTFSANVCLNSAPGVLIEPSPMTHDTRFTLRLQNHPSTLKAAVIYDFIPIDWPGYLPTVANRIEYIAKVARLRKFDLFFPISRYSASRLSELAGVSNEQITVTGASVRDSLYRIKRDLPATPSPYDLAEPYFVMLGGDDWRKNTDTAIKAVKHLNRICGRRIPLKVIGFYCDALKAKLLKIAGHREGHGFLEFHPSIPDSEVVKLHTNALAAICPSRIEGFSLPVAEAAVCSCPVIASTCEAQKELVTQSEALFQPEDHGELATRLKAVLNDPSLRASLLSAQAWLADKFHAREVGKRLWDSLESTANGAIERRERKTFSIAPEHTSHLAVLSSVPRGDSPAAFYTTNFLRRAAHSVHYDLYSDSADTSSSPILKRTGPVSVLPLLEGRHDCILSVLGAAQHEGEILRFMHRYGGPCLLHDLRLIPAFLHWLGADGFASFAAKMVDRKVSVSEVESWQRNPDPKFLFLDTLVRAASPLIIHTRGQQLLLKERYGVISEVAGCCPTINFTEQDRRSDSRLIARRRLGISESSFIVSVFGPTGSVRSLECAILAIELLRHWKIPAELFFVGEPQTAEPEIRRIAETFELTDFVHVDFQVVGNERCREFIIASDAALQLRSDEFGEVPIELVNCIAAGLPAVTTSHMALCCDAPEYVRTVPDRFSPLLVAEQLAPVWERRPDVPAIAQARLAYLETHNFDAYTRRVLDILHLDGASSANLQ